MRPTVRGMALAAGIFTGLTVLALVVIRMIFPPQQAATAIELPPAVIAPTPVNWQAEEDKRDLDELLAVHGSGYDCPVNDNAKKIADLKLCPDYTAALTFNELGTPAIVSDIAMNGVTPITMTAERVESCVSPESSDYTGKTSCETLYRVKWNVNPKYVALGNNSHYTWPNGTTTWTGPLGPDFYEGDQLMSATDVLEFEVYAGDPLTNISDQPLSDAQMSKP